MFFHATEVDVELVEVLQEGAEGGALGHLGKGVDILREALAAIAVLAIGSRDIGMGVVDVARKKHSSVHLTPVGSHLLAVFAAGVEVGDLVGSEDVVHVLGELGLKRGHDGELLADEDLGEQLMCASEDHGLLLEVLDMGALGEELRHVAHLVTGFLREAVAGARKDGGADKHRHIWEFLDELRHEAQVLCAIVLGRHMNLKESNIDIA